MAYNTVAILGLSFKQNSDDGREAVAISIVIALQSTWAKGQVYDPQAIEQGRYVSDRRYLLQNAYLCAEGASALVKGAMRFVRSTLPASKMR